MKLLSIDLNTTRINGQGYARLLESLQTDDLDIHIYNYLEQKHNRLPFCHGENIHKYIGSRKKVALDIPQALDIVELCRKNIYQSVHILCGEYESEFLFDKLDKMNVNYTKICSQDVRSKQEMILDESSSFDDTENVAASKKTDFSKEVANVYKQNKNSNIFTENNSFEQEQKPRLTAEQIKKIYTYIKFKQMERDIKTF